MEEAALLGPLSSRATVRRSPVRVATGLAVVVALAGLARYGGGAPSATLAASSDDATTCATISDCASASAARRACVALATTDDAALCATVGDCAEGERCSNGECVSLSTTDDAATAGALSAATVSSEVSQSDFLAFASVQSFLREINGTKDWDAASASALRQYVPKSLTASVTPSRAGGGIGGGAVGGYVAFGLTYAGTNSTGGTEITASYLVVMDLYGNISRVESACVGARALSRRCSRARFSVRALTLLRS